MRTIHKKTIQTHLSETNDEKLWGLLSERSSLDWFYSNISPGWGNVVAYGQTRSQLKVSTFKYPSGLIILCLMKRNQAKQKKKGRDSLLLTIARGLQAGVQKYSVFYI